MGPSRSAASRRCRCWRAAAASGAARSARSTRFTARLPARSVRVRKPDKVIEEMLHLHRQHGVRVFLFQDDDFPLWGKTGRRWANELVARMHDSGLAEKSIWKISCRAEYVEPELFHALREAGLFLVYMGIESGVESGSRSPVQADDGRAEPQRGRDPQEARHCVLLRLHAVRPVEHVPDGPREHRRSCARSSATDRRAPCSRACCPTAARRSATGWRKKAGCEAT